MSQPINIASRRELFVDHHIIAHLTDASLRLHHPQSAGPALHFDKPWEGAFSGYCTVLKAAEGFRIYYRGWPDSDDHRTAVTCVAESSDGIAFHKPALHLHEVHGTRANNVIVTCEEDMYTHNFAPMLDQRPGIPLEQRYKALTRNYGLAYEGKRSDPMGLFAFTSADGIHWRKLSSQPVITQGKFDSQNVTFWSETERCYVCYLRDYANGVRTIARCHSDDYLNWSMPQVMDMGDTLPEHLYTNQTQPYFRAPHLYVALPGRFMPGRQVLGAKEALGLGVFKLASGEGGYWQDCSDAVLLTSRGGARYDRTFMQSFVRPGRDRRNWTSRCNYPACGIIQTADDELSIYIERHSAQSSKYLERLTLRLDGFASLHAGFTGGEMLTKPLTFTGNRLSLNYASSACGGLSVEIQSQNGSAIPGFAMADCDPIIGDEIDRVVTWNNRADIAPFAGQTVRLRVALRDADLFALQFETR